jgi:hypothetical protein
MKIVTATLYDVLLLYMRTAKPESDYVRIIHGASIFIGVAQESHLAMFDFCVVRMLAYL